MKKAVYPGTFDPLTIGHLDIIKRAARIFDELHVLVSTNIFKKTTFTEDERVMMIEKCLEDVPNVKVSKTNRLVVSYCEENKINVIIRGLRNIHDYENEFTLYQFNRDINKEIETLILLPSTKNQVVSSSAIKELVAFGVDISKYVPREIVDFICEKLQSKKPD